MGRDVDGGYLPSSLSSGCCGSGESSFDGICLGGQHSICRRIIDRDAEVGKLGGVVLLGVGEDEGTVWGCSEEVGGVGVCCLEFLDRDQEGNGSL